MSSGSSKRARPAKIPEKIELQLIELPNSLATMTDDELEEWAKKIYAKLDIPEEYRKGKK